MSTAPRPMNSFAPMPDRLIGELEERQATAARSLPYHHAFFDDYLRGILPHDLVLLTAWSGLGKTELALQIAAQNACTGKRVNYFALEAEPRELERRRKYAIIARLARLNGHKQRDDLNFTDWMRGECEHVASDYNSEADRIVAQRYATMSTYYKGKKFDAEDLTNEIARVSKTSDLIVVDHLHYIDESPSESEARAISDTMKCIRDCVLIFGRPILLVAHLRKQDRNVRALVPTLDDIHGSSNITKICTQVLAIASAPQIESRWYEAPTYITVLKDRRSRPSPFVAVQMFDERTKSYSDTYTLGRVKHGAKRDEWEELKLTDRPRWARNHRPLDPQGELPSTDHPNAPGAA